MNGTGATMPITTSVRWPAERFYWAVLPARAGVEPRRARGGKTGDAGEVPAGLLTDLAEQLPIPIEEVFAVCVASVTGLVVCAALRHELEEVPPETMRVTPTEVPATLAAPGDEGVEAARFNLLVGAFEPPTQRARRVQRHLFALTLTVLVGGLLLTGLVRRTAFWEQAAEDVTERTDRLVTAALPPGIPPQALPAEVARLQRASLTASKFKPPPDAALALAALLEAWPSGAPGAPQSLSVSETGITLSVLIEGQGEGGYDPAQAFLSAFQPPRGWVMLEPRLNSGPDFARIVVDLKPGATPVAAPSGGAR